MMKVIPRFKTIKHESVLSVSPTAYPPGYLIIGLHSGWVKAGTFSINSITVPIDFDGDISTMVEFRQELKDINDRQLAERKRRCGW